MAIDWFEKIDGSLKFLCLEFGVQRFFLFGLLSYIGFGLPDLSNATKVKTPSVTLTLFPTRSLKTQASRFMVTEVLPVFLMDE